MLYSCYKSKQKQLSISLLDKVEQYCLIFKASAIKDISIETLPTAQALDEARSKSLLKSDHDNHQSNKQNPQWYKTLKTSELMSKVTGTIIRQHEGIIKETPTAENSYQLVVLFNKNKRR